MKGIILIRQATVAGTELMIEFDVAGFEYLVKNFTDGDIYVCFSQGASKEDRILIPPESAQIVTVMPVTGYSNVSILPEATSEKGVEVQCLKW